MALIMLVRGDFDTPVKNPEKHQLVNLIDGPRKGLKALIDRSSVKITAPLNGQRVFVCHQNGPLRLAHGVVYTRLETDGEAMRFLEYSFIKA